MRNYVELMRIRLSENVKLNTHFAYFEEKETLISPLIFISLIENAFKHGVSGDKPSFIDISLVEHDDGKGGVRLQQQLLSPNRNPIKVAAGLGWN